VQAKWQEVRTAVRTANKVTEVMLSGASVRGVDGSTLILSHESAPLVERLSSKHAVDVITSALHYVFGGTWQVSVHSASSLPAEPKPASATPTKARKPETKQPYVRPSRGGGGVASNAGDGEPPEPEPEPEPEPLPPEPEPVSDEDLTDDERDEMIATARDSKPDPRQDPEQIAIALLATELGAKPLL
jgi:DNA polymerase-3 subunit gamma/tau